MRRFLVSLLLFFLFFSLSLFLRHQPIHSDTLVSVKDTLSSSQLSFFARMGTGVTVNDTILRLNTTASSAPNTNTYNLSAGETIFVGNTLSTGAIGTYPVTDIGDTGTFTIGSGIGQSFAYPFAAIIATRSAIHTVIFSPLNNFTGGIFQLLIKATSRTGENQEDGIPDQQGFDRGSDIGSSLGLGTRVDVTDVTCPLSATAGVGTTVVISSNSYHIFSCTLGGGTTNGYGVGTSYTMTVGRDLAVGSQIVNPSASVGRSIGTGTSLSADVYTYYFRHLDSGSVVRDTTQGKLAVIEAVRVTATVDPTLTFSIGVSGVGVGATPCGNTMGSNASNVLAPVVPFGSLSLGAFNNLAQHLSCVTNAPGGYIVTAYENDQMMIIGEGTTIADTNCDGSCTTTDDQAWTTDTSNSEFGYAIQNINVGTSLTDYQIGYRPFGEGAANAQQIMKSTTVPSTTNTAFVCYRLTASTAQKAGNYENHIIYTATATF